jgi:hypothetical protein
VGSKKVIGDSEVSRGRCCKEQRDVAGLCCRGLPEPAANLSFDTCDNRAKKTMNNSKIVINDGARLAQW